MFLLCPRPHSIKAPAVHPVKPAAAALLCLVLAAPAWAGDWKLGPGLGFSNPDADFKLNLKGYAQYDVRSFHNFPDYTEQQIEVDGIINPSHEWRRVRIGVEGEWHWFSFEVEAEPIGVDPPPGSTNLSVAEHLKNAYGEIKVSKALRIRGGNTKLPFSPELLISEAKVDFIERSMSASRLGPGRDWGVMVYGDLKKKLTYQFGVFKGDGRVAPERAGTTVGGRLVVSPFEGLDIGGAYMQGKVTAFPEPQDAVNATHAKGMDGKGPSGFKYSIRHYVQGQRKRLDLESGYVRGPFSVKAEYIRATEERLGQGPLCKQVGPGLVCDNLPTVVADGFAASATWLLTGEKKEKTLKPKRPLPHGPGAIEIGARFEFLNFDDDGPDTGFAGAAATSRNIRPAGNRVFTGGVNWWPHELVRFTANVSFEHFKDALLAPVSGRAGSYWTLAGRVQLMLP